LFEESEVADIYCTVVLAFNSIFKLLTVVSAVLSRTYK